MKTRISASLIAALVLSGCVTQEAYDRDMGLERQINQQLLAEVEADQVKIHRLEDRLRITVENEILYPEGKAGLTREGKTMLDKIVSALQVATDHRIEVEGYTDDVPIGRHLKKRYKTNWELSAARAAGVVEYLQKQGIDPSRMTAAGHGQYQPVESNLTPEGRAANRRTDIDLVPIYSP